MAKSNGISSFATVAGGQVVSLAGERQSFGPEGVVFRHKRPRSSKMLVSLIALADVIVSTSDSITFRGDPSRYGITLYAGELNGITNVSGNVLRGEDGDGNVVLVDSSATQFTVEAEGTAEPKAKKAKTSKKVKKD